MSQNASLLFLYLKAGLCLTWSKTGFSCLDSKISLVAPLVKCLSFFLCFRAVKACFRGAHNIKITAYETSHMDNLLIHSSCED